MTRKMLMLAALALTAVFLAGVATYAAHTWVRLTPKSPPILMLIKA